MPGKIYCSVDSDMNLQSKVDQITTLIWYYHISIGSL